MVDLLNHAHLAPGKDGKLNALRQVKELIVNKVGGPSGGRASFCADADADAAGGHGWTHGAQEPELLDNFFEELTQFSAEPHADVRAYVVDFAEAAALKDDGLLSKAAAAIAFLLGDDAPAVAKRAVQAATSLHAAMFRRITLPGRRPDDEVGWANEPWSGAFRAGMPTAPGAARRQELWDLMQTMQGRIVGFLQQHENIGVRTMAVKFIEQVILAYACGVGWFSIGASSPPPRRHSFSLATRDTDKTRQAVEVSLNWVPLHHPFLDVRRGPDAGASSSSSVRLSLLFLFSLPCVAWAGDIRSRRCALRAPTSSSACAPRFPPRPARPRRRAPCSPP